MKKMHYLLSILAIIIAGLIAVSCTIQNSRVRPYLKLHLKTGKPDSFPGLHHIRTDKILLISQMLHLPLDLHKIIIG